MPVFLGIVIALLVGAAGAAGGYLYRKQASEKKIGRTEQYAKNLLEDAQRKADEKKKETILPHDKMIGRQGDAFYKQHVRNFHVEIRRNILP